MENNILFAKLDFLISLQVTLGPFCSKTVNKMVLKANTHTHIWRKLSIYLPV